MIDKDKNLVFYTKLEYFPADIQLTEEPMSKSVIFMDNAIEASNWRCILNAKAPSLVAYELSAAACEVFLPYSDGFQNVFFGISTWDEGQVKAARTIIKKFSRRVYFIGRDSDKFFTKDLFAEFFQNELAANPTASIDVIQWRDKGDLVMKIAAICNDDGSDGHGVSATPDTTPPISGQGAAPRPRP